jgi:hypothetical protein
VVGATVSFGWTDLEDRLVAYHRRPPLSRRGVAPFAVSANRKSRERPGWVWWRLRPPTYNPVTGASSRFSPRALGELFPACTSAPGAPEHSRWEADHHTIHVPGLPG